MWIEWIEWIAFSYCYVNKNGFLVLFYTDNIRKGYPLYPHCPTQPPTWVANTKRKIMDPKTVVSIVGDVDEVTFDEGDGSWRIECEHKCVVKMQKYFWGIDDMIVAEWLQGECKHSIFKMTIPLNGETNHHKGQ